MGYTDASFLLTNEIFEVADNHGILSLVFSDKYYIPPYNLKLLCLNLIIVRFERLIKESALADRRAPRATGIHEYIQGRRVHQRYSSFVTINDQRGDQGETFSAKGPLTRQKRKASSSSTPSSLATVVWLLTNR